MNIESLIKDLVKNFQFSYHVHNEGAHENLPFSVSVTLNIHGNIINSCGVDKDKDLAFFKAIMEIIERVTLTNSSSIYYKKGWFAQKLSVQKIAYQSNISPNLLVPFNSNGVGVGLSARLAQKSALLELIERHTILSAVLFNISPVKMPKNKEIAFPVGHTVSSYYWKTGSFYTVVSVDQLASGGYLFGHACSKVLYEAQRKSLYELIPNVIYADRTKDEAKIITSITKNNIISFNSYWRFSGDNRVFDFLNGSMNSKNHKCLPLLKNVYYSEVLIPTEFSSIQFPLRCFRAISPEAQQLFFDDWSYEIVNPNLLFSGKLPDFPHFIS
ncbi:MAG: hypothetical protein NDI69_18125 [Bacteriovoracaceae bacterium]|nr:hypothetical protein [Bacteriovoracaceae bacterium]